MKRLIFFAIITLLLMSAGIFGLAGSAADHPTAVEVVVKPGDTLWQIVSEHYDDSHDIRDIIARIKASNDLDGGTIHPGQILQLPR